MQNHYNAEKLQDRYNFISFFICTIVKGDGADQKESDVYLDAESCAKAVYGEDDWSSILMCAEEDTTMRDSLKNKTEAINLTTVPQVTLNGQLVTEQVGKQLLPAICQLGFTPTDDSSAVVKPRLCTSGAVDRQSLQSFQLEIFFNADTAAEAFVRSQIKSLLLDGPSSSASLALRDVLQWRFTPWGGSSYNASDGSVSCSTGNSSDSSADGSCLANRVLTCAGRQLGNGQSGKRQDDRRLVNFVLCFFDASNWAQSPLEVAAVCSSKLSPLDSYSQLWQCAKVDSKLPFLLAMKDRTEGVLGAGGNSRVEQCTCAKLGVFKQLFIIFFNLTFAVPAVSINGQLLPSVEDLAGSLCSGYQVLANIICFLLFY